MVVALALAGLATGVAGVLAASYRRARAEQRRLADFVDRLQRAVGEETAGPGLDATLQGVAAAARRTVDAKFVSVLVRDDAGVGQGALEGDIGEDRPERSTDMIAEIMRDPTTSPSGIVLTTGQRVVVPSIVDDPRFARWIPETRRQGFTSTVAVPLHSGGEVMGVLAAYFPSPKQVTPDTVNLLGAYADHAALIILRALAFDRERRAAARLAEADAMKAELVSNVSHELRTPLTSVKGFIETVLRHWDRLDDDERRHLLERSLKNTNTLAGLIDQVLDFSRLEAGAVILVLQPLCLADEVRRVVEQFASDAPIELDLDADTWGNADRDGLERVLTNLLSNAEKYSTHGDAPIRVRVWAEHGEAFVSVRDHGVGIPPDEHERIFDRFHRVHTGTGPRGTGIGLSIVKRYAELMDGRVWLESEEGKGSTFYFAVPVAEEAVAPSRFSPARHGAR